MKSKKTSITNDEAIVQELRDDPTFAAEYLSAAAKDSENPAVLLMALRHLAEARGGMARVAKKAGVERESLYRTLSGKGNPRLSTLTAVLRALGMTIRLEPAA
jgi:probable addiction module antidote protein